MPSAFKITIVAVIVILLTACGASQPVTGATEVPTESPVVEETEEPIDTATEETVVETNETPVEAATLTVNETTNCRTGPGSNFDLVIILEEGESVEILGADASGMYWVVETTEGECWLWGENASVSGDTSGVIVMVSPATPTPKPPPQWSGNWHVWAWFDPWGTDIRELNVSFTQTGSSFVLTIPHAGTTITLNGTISSDGMYVTGDVIYPPAPANLKFTLHRNPNDLRQFSGIWNIPVYTADGDICGSIGDAPKINPCRLH